MIIYPAIDIKSGRCVRLNQGKAREVTVYYEDPAEPAMLWHKAGSAWVHVVDLDGAFEGVSQNLNSVRRIVATGMKVQLGGGMRDHAAVKQAMDLGVSRVVIGTRACEDAGFVQALVEEFGDRIAVGIDARDGRVAVKGWVDTSERLALAMAADMAALGVGTLIYTDISRDGMLTGPNFEAQEALLRHVPCRIIASGGVARRSDIERFADMARHHANLDGVIIGKALYEERVDLADLLALTR
jgi:phosphoribosylformimino-5-aminoimidazole carboxamide ribotide isomerase